GRAGAPQAEAEAARGRRRGPPPGVEWSLVALVVLGGFYLRLHRIDLIPWGLNNDEAINGIEVGEIVRGKPFASVTVRGLNRETMFHYLAAFSYRNPGLALNLLRTLPLEYALDLQPKLVNDELMDLVVPRHPAGARRLPIAARADRSGRRGLPPRRAPSDARRSRARGARPRPDDRFLPHGCRRLPRAGRVRGVPGARRRADELPTRPDDDPLLPGGLRGRAERHLHQRRGERRLRAHRPRAGDAGGRR